MFLIFVKRSQRSSHRVMALAAFFNSKHSMSTLLANSYAKYTTGAVRDIFSNWCKMVAEIMAAFYNKSST